MTGPNRSTKRRACPACPACKELALAPIFYGPLPDSLADDRARGDLYWGGLIMRPDSPRWKCGACERTFSRGVVG